MGPVVSDSSALILLSAIGRLDLLRQFFGHLIIPGAVWSEVVEEGGDRPGSDQVRQAREEGWIEVIPPSNPFLVRSLQQDLDNGESEAIALAVELHASLVLLDDGEGRRVATGLGLAKTGVIGILLRAKQEGRIDLLRDELDRLRSEAGFWVDGELYRQALAAVGER